MIPIKPEKSIAVCEGELTVFEELTR